MKAMGVMRKPYETPTLGNIDAKPLKSHGLSKCGGVLSGSETRKQVYLETIQTEVRPEKKMLHV
jgi:hypothetical protein